MLKIFTSLAFFSVVLFIPIQPMQQNHTPTTPAEIEALVASFGDLSLLKSGEFSVLSTETIKAIIFMAECGTPWNDMIQIVNFRTVCRKWLCILIDINKIAHHLNIPPLHLAAMMDDTEKIIDLKLKNQPLLALDCRRYSAACYALATKKHHAAKILKIAHALNVDNEGSQEYLRSFIANDDNESLAILLLIPEKKYFNHELDAVISQGDISQLEDILLNGKNEYTIAKYISKRSIHLPHFQKLLRYTVTSFFENWLILATCEENITNNLIDGLKKEKPNPNIYDQNGSTLLAIACCKPTVNTLTQLLSLDGIDATMPSTVTEECPTPLHVAAVMQNIPAAQQLLEYTNAQGVNPVNVNAQDKKGATPLHHATSVRNLDLVKLLIKHGADVNVQSASGCTPLQLASLYGTDAIFKELVNNPTCNIELSDDGGQTPLILATCYNQPKFVEELIKKRANLLAKSKEGCNLLHFAAKASIIILTMILRALESIVTPPAIITLINEPNDLGKTSLHLAAEHGHLESVKKLVELGADIRAKTNLDKTALDLAYDAEHEQVGRYLAEQMAGPGSWAHYQRIRNW